MDEVSRQGAEGLSAKQKDLLESLDARGDREAVIIGHGYLEDALCAMLDALFVEDSEKTAREALPGHFAARCSLAYALGLVGPKMLSDLRLLGKIRNLFAHRWQTLRFSTPEIERICTTLVHGELVADGQELDSRQRYLKVISLFSTHMLGQVSRLKHFPRGNDFQWITADTPGSFVVADRDEPQD